VNGDAVGVVPATGENYVSILHRQRSAVLLAGSLMSAGGLTTLVVMKLSAKNGAKESVQKPNPKEETWVK
jgi:hypothetical protein